MGYQIQKTKRFGLKKLNQIAKPYNKANPKSRWYVSPHITLHTPAQFRMQRIGDAERILIRGDENGHNYRRLSWATMPRTEQRTNASGIGIVGPQGEIQETLARMKGEKKVYKKKLFMIVHPTRKRTDIAWTGSIMIERQVNLRYNLGPEMKIMLVRKPSPNDRTHRNITPKFTAEFRIDSRGRICRSIKKSAKIEFERIRHSPVATALMRRAVALVKQGLERKQINPQRPLTEINFLSWKEAPKRMELYDLIERRNLTDADMEHLSSKSNERTRKWLLSQRE